MPPGSPYVNGKRTMFAAFPFSFCDWDSKQDFIKFMEATWAFFTVKRRVDPNKIIFFADQSPLHIAKDTRQAMKVLGVRLLMNVSYSPEFNMAELFIRMHKGKIRALLGLSR